MTIVLQTNLTSDITKLSVHCHWRYGKGAGKMRNRIFVSYFSTLLFLVLVVGGCATTKGDWEKAQNFDTIEAYQTFLQKNPESEFTAYAKRRIERLKWENAQRRYSIESYEEFLREHPQSEFKEQAKEKIEQIRAANDVTKQEQELLVEVKKENSVKRYTIPNVPLRCDDINVLLLGRNEFQILSLNCLSSYTSLNPVSVTIMSKNTMLEMIKDDDMSELVVRAAWGNLFYFKEFSTDNLPKTVSGDYLPPLADGSIHRIFGTLVSGEYKFISEDDKFNRLTFAVIRDRGYVYLRGRGKVISADGSETLLGYK